MKGPTPREDARQQGPGPALALGVSSFVLVAACFQGVALADVRFGDAAGLIALALLCVLGLAIGSLLWRRSARWSAAAVWLAFTLFSYLAIELLTFGGSDGPLWH